MSKVNPRLVYWIAAVHQHPKLTANYRDVLVHLAVSRLDYATGTGYCSERSLAAGCGHSVATVRRALSIARTAEPMLIERTRRGHRLGNGESSASEWRLIFPAISTAHQRSVEDDSTAQGRPVGPVDDGSTAHGGPVEDGSTGPPSTVESLNRSDSSPQPLTGDLPTEPPTTNPPTPTVVPLRPDADGDGRGPVGEGGDLEGDQPLTEASLVARILTIRADLGTKPVWKAARLRQILAEPSLRAQPSAEVCARALTMAMDPETKYPTRLLSEGYWLAAPAPAPRRRAEHGPWCQDPTCNKRTRLRERTEDGRPYPCPQCHRDNVRRSA